MVNKKMQVWLPLIFSIVLILGMFFGYKLSEQSGNKKGFFASGKSTSLQEVIDLIKLNYVDPVHTDSLQQGAITEMMNELDPHSVYFPPVELKEVNDDLAGKFEGIGVEFNIFSDTVNLVYVIPEGPGDKAGLQIGDKVLKVNDSSIVATRLTADEIKKLIKGEQNTTVKLLLLRDGKQQTAEVKRGTIPVSSVDAFYMIDKTAGYIRLNKFTQNTYEEFMQSLEALQKQGLKQLVLDLRGNGGGFMNEAVDIADEFLDGRKLIVYTEGTNTPKREYRCKRDGLFEQGKLVVLVDELSASASEVLAGALQDWDRAIIIGRRTFGKGLVQEQYPLSNGGALRLTVARYYTPLGRSIQRSYEKGKKVYMDEMWERYSNGELLYADSNKISNGKQYQTPGKKIVYGGGGIMPDVFVALDTSSYQSNVNKLLLNGSFNNFVYNYYLQHKLQVNQFAAPADYIKGFSGSNEMWDQFVNYAVKDSVNLQMVSAKDKEALQKRLKAYLARYKWRSSGFFQVLNSNDSMIIKSAEVLSK